MEVACAIRKAITHSDAETVASALGFTDLTTFNKILRLADLPPELAALVEWGSRRGAVSMSTAAELLRLPGEDQPAALRAAVEADLTKEEARQVAQIHQRSGLPLAECLDQALKTRVRIERSELILGSVLTEKAQSFVRSMGPDKATARLKRALAGRFPDVVMQSVNLKLPRFSLLLKEEDAAHLREALKGQTVEKAVTGILESLSE